MEEILEHPYLKDTELTHPTSLLRDFVSEFEEWAKSGGQRYSLFNDYGAAAAKLTDDLISKPEWRFSTLESTELMEDLPAAIDQQLSSGYISNDHHLPSHLDQVADMTSTKAQEDAFNSYNASEPTSPYLSDSDLTPSGSPKAHENVTHQHETTPVSDADEKKIERGEKQLGRLFDPHHSLYNYSGLNSHQSDLPLRNLTTDSSIADNKGKEVEANVTGTTNSGNIVLIDPTTLKPKRKDRDDRADQEKIDQEIEKEKINREKIMAWEFPTGEAEDIPKDSQPHKERPNTMAWQFPEGGSGNGNGNDIHEEPQTALSSAASDHSSDTFGLAYESDHSAHSDDVDEDPHTASYNPSSSDIDGTSTSRHTLDLDAYGASPDMDAEAGDAKKSRQTLDLDALMGDMGLGSATPAAYSAQESDGGIGSSRDRDAPTANTAANLVGAPPPEDVPATYFDANGNRTSRMPPEAQPPSAESMRHDASEEVDVAELTRLLTDTVEMCDYHIQYYEQLIANMSSDEEDGGDKEDDEE